MTRDHLDRVAENGLSVGKKISRVLRHPKRVGGNRPNRLRRERAQPVAEDAQCLEAPHPRVGIQPALGIEPCREPDAALDAVNGAHRWRNTIAHGAGDQQPEAVRSKIDCGKQGGLRHR